MNMQSKQKKWTKQSLFWGRDYRIYLEMFNLTKTTFLNYSSVADLCSGATNLISFCRNNDRYCVGLDFMYQNSLDLDRETHALFLKDLAIHNNRNVYQDCNTTQLRLEAQSNENAYSQFAHDYCHHPDFYIFSDVRVALPFNDNSFDLVLNGNNLFVNNAIFTTQTILFILSEMIRISKHTVKIYPISVQDDFLNTLKTFFVAQQVTATIELSKHLKLGLQKRYILTIHCA